MNFERKAAVQVREALDDSPVAGILGPRQCGKTTLAKMLLQGRPDSLYLDMERPDDLRALTDPQAFFRLHRGRTICLDEIQRIPQIFPVIRAEVDEAEMSGRFLILGSASPDLLRQTSESLAGRIRYIYLTPFAIDEVPDGKTADILSQTGPPGFTIVAVSSPHQFFPACRPSVWLLLPPCIRNAVVFPIPIAVVPALNHVARGHHHLSTAVTLAESSSQSSLARAATSALIFTH